MGGLVGAVVGGVAGAISYKPSTSSGGWGPNLDFGRGGTAIMGGIGGGVTGLLLGGCLGILLRGDDTYDLAVKSHAQRRRFMRTTFDNCGVTFTRGGNSNKE